MEQKRTQTRTKKRSQQKLRTLALSLLVLTLVIAIVGILIHGNKQPEKGEVQTFDGGTGLTAQSALASFASWEPDSDAGSIDGPADKPTDSAQPTAESVADPAAASASEGVTLHDYAQGDDYVYAYAGFKPQTVNVDKKNWELMLVNRNYILPQDYAPPQGLAESAKGTGVQLDARVAPHYQKMYDAAKKDGITLTPLSGHRRISTQKKNFENKIQYYMNQGMDRTKATQAAAKIILPPGTSEHNAGLAMDIISLDVWFEDTKEFKWLQKHAEEYGFVLRYPKDKENITGITYEPWHWRYVGVENAKKMNAAKQCLEEYVGAVKGQ